MGINGIRPGWPAPDRVHALVTTREGGVSEAPYDSLNLGVHVGDDPARVAENRRRLQALLPAEPCWLNQVHGTTVLDADTWSGGLMDADAVVSRRAGRVCAVMTADCLPVLLCDVAGSVVAAAHAGWRGLHGGIVDATVAAMDVSPSSLVAWLGPAIGPDAFEVGEEVRQAFMSHTPQAVHAFRATATPGKWMADLYALARLRLAALGVARVYGGEFCTHADATRFFSYRRDGVTGRMASLIWLD